MQACARHFPNMTQYHSGQPSMLCSHLVCVCWKGGKETEARVIQLVSGRFGIKTQADLQGPSFECPPFQTSSFLGA